MPRVREIVRNLITRDGSSKAGNSRAAFQLQRQIAVYSSFDDIALGNLPAQFQRG